ncbi:MAG: biotin--[acetyl-CoA-carboxylase] ligase [Solirubrobacterales bacterium]|nr:biotin--[acetyl-CoA-carboxylase] ligase [Solirubrobacterales bacterium]
MKIGQPHHHFSSVASTNELARDAAAAGAVTGTLFTAEEQTEGRGRQGRPWSTPAGSALAWSVVLRREIEIPGILPLAVGVAICEAVESLGVDRALVKWPNDVWIEGRKCAGILIEARPQAGWAVIGVGLNLTIAGDEFPEDLRSRATSVGHGATVRSATLALNEAVGRWLDAAPHEVTAEFSRRDALRGRTVSWPEGSGLAAGIDRAGNLLVESSVGCLATLNAGEVHLSLPDDESRD